MINLSAQNGIDSFVRLTNLQCNGSYFGSKYGMFIVRIVSEMELENIDREWISGRVVLSAGAISNV